METVLKPDTRGYMVEVPVSKSLRARERGVAPGPDLVSSAGRGGKRYQMHNLDGPKDGEGRPTGKSLGQSYHPRHHNSEAIELAHSRGERVGVVDMQTGRVLVEAMPDDGGDVFYRKFYHQDGAGHDDKAADRTGILEQGTVTCGEDGTRIPQDVCYWNPQGKATGQSGELDGKRSQKRKSRGATGKEYAAEGDSAVREV